MAICNDPSMIHAAVAATVYDQPRRRLKMLELWVSEIEPEFSYDSIYAPGKYRSTVHWNGVGATYSYRQPGMLKRGRLRNSLEREDD